MQASPIILIVLFLILAIFGGCTTIVKCYDCEEIAPHSCPKDGHGICYICFDPSNDNEKTFALD